MTESAEGTRRPASEGAMLGLAGKSQVSGDKPGWPDLAAALPLVKLRSVDSDLVIKVVQGLRVAMTFHEPPEGLASEEPDSPRAVEHELQSAAARYWTAATGRDDEGAEPAGTVTPALVSLEAQCVAAMTRYVAVVGHSSAAPADEERTGAVSVPWRGVDRDRPWHSVRSPAAGKQFSVGSLLDDVADMYGPPDMVDLRRPASGRPGLQQDADNIRHDFATGLASLGAADRVGRVAD